jgi:hypothetical protein
MSRRALIRERVDQPQGLVGPAAAVHGMRVTLLHTPSMGAPETARGLRRNGQLGAGVSLESMSGGEAAYRFTGAQASGACSFGVARATQSSGSFVILARFRLNALGGSPLTCWGTGGNFLMQTDSAGNITTACGDSVNQSVFARATSGLGLQVGVVYTVALGYLAGNPPTLTGAINGRPLSFPTSVVGFGDTSVIRDSAVRSTQIGIADDGGPMNGFVSLAAVLVGRHSQAILNDITANPWQVGEPTARSINIGAITVYRPGSDVAVSGWTPVGAATRAAALADESGATWAESPDLTTPDTYDLTPAPFPAGPATARITADRTAGAGSIRAVFLDAAGTPTGTTAWQPLTGTAAEYTLTTTVSALSPRIRIEVQP